MRRDAKRICSLKDFNRICQEFAEEESLLLKAKREDYARDQRDRLMNFRDMAIFEKRPMSHITLTFLLKHIHSISVQVRAETFTWDWKDHRGHEALKQRIADARNYLLLLAACIEEEVENKESFPGELTPEKTEIL